MKEEKEKVSGLHKDITYTTREDGSVSGFSFHSDEGREKFRQFQILNVLKMEVMSTKSIVAESMLAAQATISSMASGDSTMKWTLRTSTLWKIGSRALGWSAPIPIR